MTSNFLAMRRVTKKNVDQYQDNTPTNTPVSAKPSIISALQNIFNDPEVNKDANFLDDLQKVFEGNETTLMFKFHLKYVTSAFL